MEHPPIDDWAEQHALIEVFRIARERPADYEADVQPRLRRLTPEQRAILEAGLVLLEAEER